MPVPPHTFDLDKFDLKILGIVQGNNLVSHRAISHAVNLSIPSVARRLQRLRAAGAIAADRSVLNPDWGRGRVSIVVHVSAERDDIAAIEQMKAHFQACAQVQQCYYVAGDIDFILVVTTRDFAQYAALTHTLFHAGANVRHFRTFVAMERVKYTLDLPLDDDVP